MNASDFRFGNDTTLFCENDCNQIINVHIILMWFASESSLIVNFVKEFQLACGGRGQHQVIPGILRIDLEHLSSSNPTFLRVSYLSRSQLGNQLPRNLKNYGQIVKYLAKQERLTLIKSFFPLVHLNCLKSFSISCSIASNSEAIQWSFLWAFREQIRISPSEMGIVKHPVPTGGLNIRPLVINENLQGKRLWTLKNEKDTQESGRHQIWGAMQGLEEIPRNHNGKYGLSRRFTNKGGTISAIMFPIRWKTAPQCFLGMIDGVIVPFEGTSSRSPYAPAAE